MLSIIFIALIIFAFANREITIDKKITGYILNNNASNKDVGIQISGLLEKNFFASKSFCGTIYIENHASIYDEQMRAYIKFDNNVGKLKHIGVKNGIPVGNFLGYIITNDFNEIVILIKNSESEEFDYICGPAKNKQEAIKIFEELIQNTIFSELKV